jgi:transposase-like protein
MRQIRGSTESVHTGATEIAQGNASLSQRAEQQAASLEETASSEERWDSHFPAISRRWRADWSRLTVMFDYPPPIRPLSAEPFTPPMPLSR